MISAYRKGARQRGAHSAPRCSWVPRTSRGMTSEMGRWARLRRGAGQDLALAGVVGGADDTLVLHPLHQRGGAVVADLQAALDVAGRGLAVAGDHGHGAVVEIVALAALATHPEVAGL